MVNVPDGQFEKAFRRFRNKIQESGLLLELRDRMEYEKPSIKKKKAKNQARRRWLKKIENSQLPEKVY
jgi:ribosomal protein S21